jgi:hypothetical protein
MFGTHTSYTMNTGIIFPASRGLTDGPTARRFAQGARVPRNLQAGLEVLLLPNLQFEAVVQ